MDRCCQYNLIFYLGVFGCICASGYQYGTISVVGPAFVNREVTLKATPLFPWGCDIEWKYKMEGGTTFQTMHGQNIKRYSEDGSFFLKWTASIEYNRSTFYAGCSANTTIRTRMVSLDMAEKDNWPMLTVPEVLDGESSSTMCEVRDAILAPLIEIRVGKVLLSDVQQTDSFNESSHTFTSIATATKTNRDWNGKEMCCDRKSKDDFGLKDVSVCKNISTRYPPTDLSMSVNTIHEYNNNVSVCFFNISCKTDESNPPCKIKWSSDIDSLIYVHRNDWTNGESGSYRSISTVRYNVTEDMAEGTITCSTRCDHFQFRLNKNYKISFSDVPTLYLNTTSPVVLHPNITVTVKCFVDDLNNSGQWNLWWEDENSTEIEACIKAEECLLTLNYTGGGDKTYICNTWKPKELLRIP
ncbi:uncharacterized protein LOC128246388 [Mya arenaria]|uniref:uncharacterized protein LOC128246388 n=1 Tax=Mya arenaria TaxID=6604 RepID=UPI0022DF1B22|nr:uncharacterized protein LOC128246388 [Mya arenaria]